MRWLPLALGVMSLAIAAPVAQQTQPQPPVFRSGVELVTVDVTVVGSDGKPVKGLTARDFVVTLEGQPRPVRALDFLEFGVSSGSDVTTSRQTTNQQTPGRSASRGGRVFLILIDDLSSKPGQAKALLTAAERVLDTLDPADLVGVVTTSGLGPAVNPTRNRTAVSTALKSKLVIGRYDDTPAEFFIGVQEALQIERDRPPQTFLDVVRRECGDEDPYGMCAIKVRGAAKMLARNTVHRAAMQITAYKTAIEALRKAPAPKVIVALSAGLAIGADGEPQYALEPVSRAAAESGVQFYALVEEANDFDMRDNSYLRAAARREEGAYLIAGVQTVASWAGGEAFKVIGQPDRFLTRIVSETSGIYRLAVEAPLLAEKRRYVTPKVTVVPSGLTVRIHRQALVASAEAESTPIDERLRTRLAQGGIAYGVPIALGTAVRRDASARELQLAVNIQVPSTVHGPIVTMFSILNEAGQVVLMGRKAAPAASGEDYQLALPISVAAGRYRLRLAVADGRGNIGSVEHPVGAGLSQIGRFLVSDLFTTWSGDDGRSRFLALETLPVGAVTLRASLELYTRDATVHASDLVVRIALVRPGRDIAILERESKPAQTGTTLTASAELPVSSLEPGTYTIRATIQEGAATLGTVATTLRKN